MFGGIVAIRLRETREARGWSAARVCRAMGDAAGRLDVPVAAPASLRVMLSRWENGRATPDATNRALLEAVFGVPAESLGFEPAPAPAGDVAPIRPTRSTPAAVLDYFAAQLVDHARLDNIAGPSFVLTTASAQLRQLEALAENGAPEVAALAARFAEFTGWLHQDTGDVPEALRLTGRSVDLADVSGNDALMTYNLMRKSNVLTSAGERHTAASTARRALDAATDRHPELVPVCLRQHALAASRIGDETRARDAIERALTLAEPAVGTEGFSAYCTRAYVQMEAALCLLALRRPAEAEQVCTDALSAWPAELPRDRTLCLVRRGVALVELQEVDEACRTALQAVEGVRSAPSGRTVHMLRKIAIGLRPYRRNPHVRELTEALADVA